MGKKLCARCDVPWAMDHGLYDMICEVRNVMGYGLLDKLSAALNQKLLYNTNIENILKLFWPGKFSLY